MAKGMPDNVRSSFNFKPKPAPVEEEQSNDNAVFTANTAVTPLITRNPGGRPRGITKVKKTFYLTDAGLNSLNDAVLELGTRARIRIKDDSEVCDIALALLAEVVREPGGPEKIKAIREHLQQAE